MGIDGNPGPLGLLCFGMTTDMLMFVTTGWAQTALLPTVASYALFYGGAGQFAAGILELIKGNTFAGTAFSSYGCFWMGWWLTKRGGVSPDEVGHALWCGLWAVLTMGFFIVSLKKNACLQTIFGSLVITFALLAAGTFYEKCEKAAGYVGFFCGSSAIYAAFAMLYKDELGVSLPGIRDVSTNRIMPGEPRALSP